MEDDVEEDEDVPAADRGSSTSRAVSVFKMMSVASLRKPARNSPLRRALMATKRSLMASPATSVWKSPTLRVIWRPVLFSDSSCSQSQCWPLSRSWCTCCLSAESMVSDAQMPKSSQRAENNGSTAETKLLVFDAGAPAVTQNGDGRAQT